MTVMAPAIEHKILALQDASIDSSGTLSGYAAVFGNRDDGGDIIEPGFFVGVIPDFLREGFIAAGHDWNLPIAMPMTAAEDGKGLRVTASYHSDPESQRYRTIASERMAAGKQVGLSIGYEIAPGGATIEKDGRHLRKASRLFEFSQVTVPMNRLAEATDVKSLQQKAAADNVMTATDMLADVLALINAEAADLEPADPDAAEDAGDLSLLGEIRDRITQYIAATAAEVGTPDDVAEQAAAVLPDWGYMGRSQPIAKHADHVMEAVAVFQRRVKRYAKVSGGRKEGRVLSSSNVDRLGSVADALAGLVSDIKDLLASATAEKGLAGDALELAFLETMARAEGHLTPN